MVNTGNDNVTLPKLGDALADPEPMLIYREAKLQYEALIQQRREKEVDLMKHYRTLFEVATKELREDQRFTLLQLCFAYKRRWMVLRFLDDLDEHMFDWVVLLRTVVSERGKDSLFDGKRAEEEGGRKSKPQVRKRSRVHQKSRANDAGPSNSGRVGQDITAMSTLTPMPKPTKQQAPYFLISTLSLAYPTQFFTAYASLAPLSHFTIPHLLSCPAILPITLSPSLWPALESRIRKDWGRLDVGSCGSEEWTCFFEHLLRSEEKLCDHCFRRPVLDPDVRGGYDAADLDMWLRKWFGNRQMAGLKERGMKARREINAGASVVLFMDDGEDDGEEGGGGGMEIDREDETATPRKKMRVRWYGLDE